MQHNDRKQERQIISNEFENDLDTLEFLKFAEYELCCDYQSYGRSLKEAATAWGKNNYGKKKKLALQGWQEVAFALYKENFGHHVCQCHKLSNVLIQTKPLMK